MRWYTREDSEPSEEYGKRPENRDIKELLHQGILLVDKPFGPTSNQVSTWIKKELDLHKTGHFGTLDPNATGVLPVGVNHGTRVQSALAEARKEYIFEAELEDQQDEEEIRETLVSFKGTNRQTPPEKSAVKREEREREVYDIELLEAEEKRILARVECESGFYVRVLVRQLGKELDSSAEMTELRRTRQAGIEEEECDTLQHIVDAFHYYREGEGEKLREVLHPVEKAVCHLPKVVIKVSAVNAVANGADLGASGISKLQDGIQEGDRVAITTLKGELVALATAKLSSEQMYDGDGTAATLNSVHMEPSRYPKRWKQDG